MVGRIPEIGVSDSHHPLSHHQDEAGKLERLHKVNEGCIPHLLSGGVPVFVAV